jgi:D-alanyl-D-alanine carboxypeptidase/D-alanyl-D-alanine-endopeptidase (penicillin-binding protein 4)
MKKLATLLIILSGGAWGNPELTAEFRSLVNKNKLGPVTEQSYCYLQDGKLGGYQPLKLQRIASVSKLFSSLLVSETTNLHRTFKTKIYIGKDSLHIEGGRDPYFEEDKLLLLFKALNDLGYKKFRSITFNRDFLFYDLVLDEYEKITPEKSRTRLFSYVSAKNKNFIESKWKSVRKFALEEGISLDDRAPALTALSVTISDVNPLKNENTLVFKHESVPFHQILKAMNVQSKNYVAENVYETGMRIKNLTQVLTEKGIKLSSHQIHNGSGLPIIGKTRIDNQATCETVLKVIEALSDSLERQNLVLSDVVAVNGGQDLGSFRNRFRNYPETHEAVISKTGTLKHTSSLAGVLMIDEEMPFAILNHTSNSAVARNFQDTFVSRMFDSLGTPTPLVYSKISIFPWQGGEFLKPSR